jgi:flagellar hook-basal body complex protein FliE
MEKEMIAGIQGTDVASGGIGSATRSIADLAGNRGESFKAADSPFADLLSNAIGKVGELEDHARNAVNGLISGSGVDVHQAMIAAEQASMAFEMALAVRNKAIQSYQSVMGMQF